MTPAERINPSLINSSRRRRVAQGSGTTIQDVNRLLKQFEDFRKLWKQMNRNGENPFQKKRMVRVERINNLIISFRFHPVENI